MAKQGPRLESPCRLFAGSASFCVCIRFAKTLKTTVFVGKILANEGEMQGQCRENDGGMKGSGSGNDRKAMGNEMETRGTER